ncbi:MAG: rhodanese-like domain-containing protein [Kiloniellales bacterium]
MGGPAVLKKGFKQMMAEANAVIDNISADAALELIDDADAVFVDVREAGERAQGFIPNSVHAPRGFLEFIADPEGPMHVSEVSPEKRLILYCGSGGRSALAAKTLHDMGFPRVASLVGGFPAWTEAGGSLES